MPAEIAGVRCQALAVPLSIRIAAFHAQAQCTEYGFRGLQLVGELFDFEQRLYPGKQLLGENWLVEEIVGASLDSTQPVLAVAQTGNQHKRNQSGSRVVLELTTEFVARLAGHDDVGKNQIRKFAANFSLGVGRVWSADYFVAAGAQKLPHKKHGIGVVVYHQDT